MRAVVPFLAPLLCACTLENPGFTAVTTGASSGIATATSISSMSTAVTVDETGETTATSETSTGVATTSTTTTSTTTTSDPTTTAAETTETEGTTTEGTTEGTTMTGDLCRPGAPQEFGPELVLAPDFSNDYAGYILGKVPGLKDNRVLGGLAVAENDDNTLLIAGDAETAKGGLYQIGIVRGECGHIIAYEGEASLVAAAPQISDILVLADGPIFYSEWDTNHLSQHVESMDVPFRTDLSKLKPLVKKSIAGFALVPPGLAAAGELRILSWDTGDWYHLTRKPKGESFELTEPMHINSLPKGSGGVAYVPAGSPGFAQPHVLITRSEKQKDQVVVYRVDAQGDPLVDTQRVLVSDLKRASNAYFDRVTGDLLLSTIEVAGGDRIYVIQGFEQPPKLQS